MHESIEIALAESAAAARIAREATLVNIVRGVVSASTVARSAMEGNEL